MKKKDPKTGSYYTLLHLTTPDSDFKEFLQNQEKHPLYEPLKHEFLQKCHLSTDRDKECPFAFIKDNELQCTQIIGWYDDLSVKNLKKCFIKLWERDRVAWRNRMLKKKKFKRSWWKI